MGDKQSVDLRGLSVSPVGFGAFKIGRNEGVKYAERYDLPDQHAVDVLLNDVLDCGITYIDTAPAYGLSEDRIGRAVAHRRDEFILSTKVGERFANGKSTYDFSEAAVRRSVHRSLERLRTDVLDLVFIHSTHDEKTVLEATDVVSTLHALRDEGLVRKIGFSGYTADAVESALPWCDAIMVEYHLECRSLEPVIATAAARGVSVMVKKGLASGRLNVVEAIRFVLSNTGVTSLLIGGLNRDHVRDNIRLAAAVRGGEWSHLPK